MVHCTQLSKESVLNFPGKRRRIWRSHENFLPLNINCLPTINLLRTFHNRVKPFKFEKNIEIPSAIEMKQIILPESFLECLLVRFKKNDNCSPKLFHFLYGLRKTMGIPRTKLHYFHLNNFERASCWPYFDKGSVENSLNN